MSGYADFYRSRILLSANIPQIEEGAITGYITLYSIAPAIMILNPSCNFGITLPETPVIAEDPVSIDLSLSLDASIPTITRTAP